MKNKLNQLFKLRDYFFEDPNSVDEEGLIETVKKINLEIPEFIKDENPINTKLFVCPDREYEFPFVFEISEKYLEQGIDIIYNAIKEYYQYSDFYDCFTSIGSDELLKLFLYIENIPIVRFFDVCDVELLNIRKLNYEL